MAGKQKDLFENYKSDNSKKKSRVNSLNGLVSSLGGSYTSVSPIPNNINNVDMLQNNQKTDMITLNRALLSWLYVNYGLVQTIVDVPVDDAFRGKIDIVGYETSPKTNKEKEEKALNRVFNSVKSLFNSKESRMKTEDIDKEKIDVDSLIKLEKYEDRKKAEDNVIGLEIETEKDIAETVDRELDAGEIKLIKDYLIENDVIETIKYAIKWGRLYGGGGIVINTAQKPDTKLNIEDINQDTPLAFYHADLWELSGIKKGNPKGDVKLNFYEDKPFNYYGNTLHKSRVLVYKGKEAPSMLRYVVRGWGMSEIERFVRSINEFIKNNNVIYELLDEAKTDVYSLSGFNDSLQDADGTNAIAERMTLASKLKNYTNAVAIDSEDTYSQKQVSFSGLADIAQQFRLNVASDLRMPLTKIFGMSSAGFNSGDDDIENYNNMVESEIRTKARFIFCKVLEVVARKVLGKTCKFDVVFQSLRTVDPVSAEKIKNSKYGRDLKSYFAGVISAKELIDHINKEDLLGFKVSERRR